MSYADRVLRHHVTGAIERGEAVPIVEVRPSLGHSLDECPKCPETTDGTHGWQTHPVTGYVCCQWCEAEPS